MPTIVTMPAALYSFSELRFNLGTVNATSPATPFNPNPRLEGPSLELWEIAMTMTPMIDDDLDALERFLSSLRGGKVLARIFDKRRVAHGTVTQPRGAGAGPVVNLDADEATSSESITLRNLTASQAVALRAMDQLGIGDNLYRVQDNAASDAGGLSTISIRPGLRGGIAEGDPVNLVAPTGLFRLVGGDRDFGVGNNYISHALSLSFIEEPEFG